MCMDRDIDNDDVAHAVDADDDDGAWQPPLFEDKNVSVQGPKT